MDNYSSTMENISRMVVCVSILLVLSQFITQSKAFGDYYCTGQCSFYEGQVKQKAKNCKDAIEALDSALTDLNNCDQEGECDGEYDDWAAFFSVSAIALGAAVVCTGPVAVLAAAAVAATAGAISASEGAQYASCMNTDQCDTQQTAGQLALGLYNSNLASLNDSRMGLSDATANCPVH